MIPSPLIIAPYGENTPLITLGTDGKIVPAGGNYYVKNYIILNGYNVSDPNIKMYRSFLEFRSQVAPPGPFGKDSARAKVTINHADPKDPLVGVKTLQVTIDVTRFRGSAIPSYTGSPIHDAKQLALAVLTKETGYLNDMLDYGVA